MFSIAINPAKYLIIVSFLAYFLVGCEHQKYTQCQEIIAIANGASDRAKEIANSSQDEIVELKTWLEAADIMTVAAKQIEALPIKDPLLIDYQGNLASVFRIYSEATYDAVQAREKKNLSELKTARDRAQEAGKINQTLVTEINSYCTIQ